MKHRDYEKLFYKLGFWYMMIFYWLTKLLGGSQ